MEHLKLDMNKRYTFADYVTWLDDKRRELIDGFVKMMTPAPSTKHQQVLREIEGQIWWLLRKHKCQVFPIPFDVRLPSSGEIEDDKIYTVVQPDICIICDENKLDEKGCIGAPDLIVEIISKSTAKKDVEDKFILYQKAGVKEYWLVQPNDETVTVFHLENKKYQHKGIYTRGSRISPFIFDGKISVELDEVFQRN